jgi:RNA polymerase sigma-70 factor (ECF subfamily)
MVPTTHASLIAGLRDESPGAWDRFNRLYRPWLLAWTGHHLGFQSEDAEEVVQQVMLDLNLEFRAQRSGTRPAFVHNGRCGAFRSWLRSITRHRALAFLRSGRLRRPVANGEEVLRQFQDPNSALSALWDQEHEQQVIRQAWEVVKNEFEDNVWQAVGEVLFKGRRAREVAAAFRLPLRTLYSHQKAIKDRMRVLLDGMLDD